MKKRWMAGRGGRCACSCSPRAATTTAAASATTACPAAARRPVRVGIRLGVRERLGIGHRPVRIRVRHPSRRGETDNELVNAAVDAVPGTTSTQQVDELVAATTTFTDAVRAGDVEAAKAAYAPSRVSWERIEPIAGLDPRHRRRRRRARRRLRRPDDPNWTGWHRLEYLLWEQNTTEGGAEFADKLDADLASLQAADRRSSSSRPARSPVGAAELIEEVSEGKITGEEDRYSHTDLWDFAANIDGSKQLIALLDAGASKPRTRTCRRRSTTASPRSRPQLAAYEDGNGGYVSYEQLTDADKDADEGDARRALGERVAGRAAPSAWSRPGASDATAATRFVRPRPPALPALGGRRRGRGRGRWPGAARGCSDDPTHADEPAEPKEAEARAERDRVPFYGEHQAGVLLPRAGVGHRRRVRQPGRATAPSCATRSASCRPKRRSSWTVCRPNSAMAAFPPTDSGVFGDELPPAELSVIVGVGASLFDDRYGLASRKPRELERMPFIANDRLDPALTHGDVSLTISAGNADTTNYALRQLMRRTRGAFTLRWMLEGFNTIQGDFGAGFAPGRNLLGFKDGTANPDADRRRADGRARLGRPRRATSPRGPRADVPGDPHHPDVRRVLGPDPARASRRR